ncbi:MAG: TIGR01777 family protein [Caldithrix sp.]|nr:MAG: TIGR01777 family protein [Caldithrix sp.]
MKILISGASGLVGTALEPFLRVGGHDVNKLVRTKNSKNCCDVYWDPYHDELDQASLHGVEAVVHLSGENIAGRWTSGKKARIRDSRITTTRLLSQTIANLEHRPKVFVCASAVGYYGDRGDELLSEDSKFGDGFLADVVREWEAATAPAAANGIRTVNLRIGVVLSRAGGALAKMLTPFKMGAGGIIGSGKQYWSWVAIDDVVGAIHHALITESLKGPVNLVAPQPVTNAEFTKTLGRVISRPTLFPMPAFAAKAAFGEMAEALLLASTRVEPRKLVESGYQFKHPDLEGALQESLKKNQ